MANKNAFAISMMINKYFKKMGIDTHDENSYILVGGYNKSVGVFGVFFTPSEFRALAAKQSAIINISIKNAAFRVERMGAKPSEVRDKKEVKMSLKNTELLNRAVKQANNDMRKMMIFTAEQFEQARNEIKAIKNQRNKGYAFEKLVYEYFGLEWNPLKKGVDLEIDGKTIEIKFYNGQVTL